jgi:regulator of cell morphogenesis and NO signaling
MSVVVVTSVTVSGVNTAYSRTEVSEMQATVGRTVGEIAIENPSSIRVFEVLGIDYCCGGKLPLHEACSRANIGLERVIRMLDHAELDAATPVGDAWTEKPLSELIDHIVEKHHGYVRREALRIAGLLTKVEARHGALHPEIASIEGLFLALAQEMATHMMKEEHVLFPYIVRMEHAVHAGDPLPGSCFSSVDRPIANMMADHEDAGALLSKIRQLSNEFTAPAGACASFVALYRGLEEFERDLHSHIHLENNILFPRAIEMESGKR